MLASFLYWLPVVITWYLGLLVLSVLALPLGALLFHQLKDRGYAFYKILGLVLTGYVFFVLTRLKITELTQIHIYTVLLVFVAANFWLKRKIKLTLPSFKTIVYTEALFFIALAGYLYIKGSEPTIRTLEKYMDYGFIKSILEGKTLPPQDHWYASTKEFFAINYYYFGHFITAFLTRLTNLSPSVTYNLMLGTIFAAAVTMSFSLGYNLFLILTEGVKRVNKRFALLAGALAAYLVNLSGNLQTIYLFTKGYLPENPVPFWEILSGYNPTKYWYPNATRFIPFTIHEFPAYSYVVSDLHGHVLDIPFVLVTFALFITLLLKNSRFATVVISVVITLMLGVMYMTNSSDFLVYGSLLFLILVIKHRALTPLIKHYIPMIVGALLATIPFSLGFKPFSNSIGVNCAADFLVKLGRLGPFIFEANKCQSSPFWMLFILWGFFWINFVAFLALYFMQRKRDSFNQHTKLLYFIFFVFVHSILLTLFAEFFYFKDIYPAHFRANTMFKLGYQAFMIMSLLSAVVIVKSFATGVLISIKKCVYWIIVIPAAIFIMVYPFFAFPSYFGTKGFETLDGAYWIYKEYPDRYEIIQMLQQRTHPNRPFALVEAQGDSYTDYNMVSSFTGIPTIIGWPVHEWLWRSSYDVVAPRGNDVKLLYEADQSKMNEVKKIIKKYHVRYVIITPFERTKYPSLNVDKFYIIGTAIYKKNNSYVFEIK